MGLPPIRKLSLTNWKLPSRRRRQLRFKSLLVGIQNTRWAVTWNGTRPHLNLYSRIILTLGWNFVFPTTLPHNLPRARIAGAKKVCEPEELIRTWTLKWFMNFLKQVWIFLVSSMLGNFSRRTNKYDGLKEYHVDTRDNTTRSQKHSESETRTKREIPEVRKSCFHELVYYLIVGLNHPPFPKSKLLMRCQDGDAPSIAKDAFASLDLAIKRSDAVVNPTEPAVGAETEVGFKTANLAGWGFWIFLPSMIKFHPCASTRSNSRSS